MLIETERLLLQLPKLGFAETCAAYYERNRGWRKKTSYPFYIFRKEEPDVMIGKLSLNNVVWGEFRSCFAGAKMDQDFINQGYMTEATKAVIAYAFDVLELHRIEANIMPRNKRSLRFAEKCGFQYEGLSEKYLMINGIWEDHVHMVIRNHKMEM